MPMTVGQVLATLKAALQNFCIDHAELLQQNPREDAISGALFNYIKVAFNELSLDVDTQYDKRNVDNKLQKKQVMFLASQLPRNKQKGQLLDDNKLLKDVIPDLIIHKRTDNEHNFLAIELKKSKNTSRSERQFDLLKLKVYTSDGLNYRYGAFVDIKTGNDYDPDAPFTIDLFADGEIILLTH